MHKNLTKDEWEGLWNSPQVILIRKYLQSRLDRAEQSAKKTVEDVISKPELINDAKYMALAYANSRHIEEFTFILEGLDYDGLMEEFGVK